MYAIARSRRNASTDFFRFFPLYDHQGPIARGSYHPPTPLTVRVMRNALTGRGLNHRDVTIQFKILQFNGNILKTVENIDFFSCF